MIRDKSIGEAPVTDHYTRAIENYTQSVKRITDLGVAAIHQNDDLQEQLTRSANQLTDMLRWERRYAEAIALQEQLIQYLPEDAAMLRVVVSTLRIESGNVKVGFAELLEIAEQDPNSVWGWITLGSTYLWAGQYEEAEGYLLRAINLETVVTSDRAVAYQYLFKLYGVQKRVNEAIKAWEQAVSLDPTLEATVPDLLRVLIYWYHYDTAEIYLRREHSDLRRNFYQNLINVKRSAVFPRSSWDWVMKHDPKALIEGHDEFAEACLRFVKPRMALEALEPLIDRADFNRRRLVAAGLAWAQERMIDRAKWALDLAVRVGEFERPRGTRRSTGGSRILDAESRILYAEINVDPDIREEVDHYFMPVVDND